MMPLGAMGLMLRDAVSLYFPDRCWEKNNDKFDELFGISHPDSA